MLKYEVVKQRLLNEIKQLQPNERIMSRQAMCRKFGFSRSTVDMAINELIKENILYAIVGSGTYVNEEYRSSAYAMKEGIESWGIILPDMVNDIYPSLIRGVEDYCRQKKINVVICNTDNDPSKQNDYADRLVDSGVKGIIVIPAIATERNVSGLLNAQKKNIPIVFCNRAEETIPMASFVCSNDFYGGYIATKHLIHQGYQRIAYVSQRRYKISIDRYCGYASALMEEGIKIDQSIVLIKPDEQNERKDQVFEFAKALLKSSDPPDAFFCFNDHSALSVYRAVRDVGKRISQDVGIIGYDNTELCEAVEVKLTSVYFKSYDMGKKAAEILDKEINGDEIQGNRIFVFQPEIVIRNSCLGKEEDNERNNN